VIVADSVSKLHAILRKSGATWELTDQRSTNGTFVNGLRLDSGATARLSNDTTIMLGGDVVARFFLPEGLHAYLRKSPKT
jgi:pSer/pThr/pTyr-binding forkhead associated (FHA) protein